MSTIKLRHQTLKKKQTNKQNKTNNEQINKRENSKHVMIAAHTLAVNIF